MKTITSLNNYNDEMGNTIEVGEGAKCSTLKLKFMERNSKVILGDNVNLTNSDITLGNNSTLRVESNSILKGKISIGYNSSVTIGRGLRVTSSLYIRAVESTNVIIGDECLIATDVVIRTNDGHPIYDTKSGERLNKSQDINIGNHVWLADEAVILKGVKIGDGSVIAMRSVVTKDIKGKAIAAGIPARVIKEDCTWEYDVKSKTESLYD